jgi:hydroxymethylglutaryl-CoA reductase (NADPH)
MAPLESPGMPDASELADRVAAGELRLHELEEHADAETAAAARRTFIRDATDGDLNGIGEAAFEADAATGNVENLIGAAHVPMGVAGPVPVHGQAAEGEYYLPLATTEGALVASVNRGLGTIAASGGAEARVIESKMTRAPVFRTDGVSSSTAVAEWARANQNELAAAAESTEPEVSDPDGEISEARWFDDLPEDTRDRHDLEAWRDHAL